MGEDRGRWGGGLFAKGDFGWIGDWEWGSLVVEGGVREGLGRRVCAKDAKVRKGD